MTLPTKGAREVLLATYEVDPHAVKQAILRAFQAAGGDGMRAADELGIDAFALGEWVAKLGLSEMIEERWPPKET